MNKQEMAKENTVLDKIAKNMLDALVRSVDLFPPHQQKDLFEMFFSSIVVGLKDIKADLYLPALQYYKKRSGPTGSAFDSKHGWHAERALTRTKTVVFTLTTLRPDLPCICSSTRTYRNPLIYARELHNEMVGANLTRKQLAQRHGITSDRVTQWLCLLKLPAEVQTKVLSMGDNWERQLVSERSLRLQRLRKS